MFLISFPWQFEEIFILLIINLLSLDSYIQSTFHNHQSSPKKTASHLSKTTNYLKQGAPNFQFLELKMQGIQVISQRDKFIIRFHKNEFYWCRQQALPCPCWPDGSRYNICRWRMIWLGILQNIGQHLSDRISFSALLNQMNIPRLAVLVLFYEDCWFTFFI